MYVNTLICVLSAVVATQAMGSVRETAIAEVLAADRAFNAMAQEQGYPVAYATFVAPDAKMIRPGQKDPVMPNVEAEAASKWAAGTKLSWASEHADASDDGSMGFTWGRLAFHGIGADGKPFELGGNYSIVWKRQADQRWKVVLDISTPGPKPIEKQ